jgi:uncharacterized protein YjlB
MPNRETQTNILQLERKLSSTFNDIVNSIVPNKPVKAMDLLFESTAIAGEHTVKNLFEDLSKGVLIRFNSWKKGTFSYTHYHPEADQYIYVVEGKLLLTHLSGKLDILVPMELLKIDDIISNPLALGWIKIPKSIRHSVRAVEDSQFVSKFILTQDDNRPDSISYS